MVNTGNAIQRLRLNRAELHRVAEMVTQSETGRDGERAAVRVVPVHRPAVMVFSKHGQTPVRQEVYTRNISEAGASVLHTAFLVPDSVCNLVMVSKQRKPVALEARVARCGFVKGQIHDVGLQFSVALNPEQCAALSVIPDALTMNAATPQEALRLTLARCTELAEQIGELIRKQAPVESVVPLLEELRAIEPSCAHLAVG